jgi:hypothetical protein
MGDQDEIKITILPDGTIKVSTDEISPDNHLSADRFVREMSRLAGGETTIEAKHGQTHSHNHAQAERHLHAE